MQSGAPLRGLMWSIGGFWVKINTAGRCIHKYSAKCDVGHTAPGPPGVVRRSNPYSGVAPTAIASTLCTSQPLLSVLTTVYVESYETARGLLE